LTRTRRILALLLLLACAWVIPVSVGAMNPSRPFDDLLNLWPAPADAASVRTEQPRPLVVLQHGLWRSSASLGRLERALRAHGYDVVNPTYPSTAARIEQHADALAVSIDAWCREHRRPADAYFVGHSLGGLVIRAYLARPDALPARACVFLGTPQRGASLVEQRRQWLLFRILMGDLAALELSPLDPIHDRLPVPAVPCGTIAGARGTVDGWNPAIPGDDDGTVAVAEARLPGATDAIELRMGHTRLSFADEPILQVLHFLAHGRFRR
jgi:pimeloyl-ACP methyl ester carboxylesterase